MTWYNGGNWSGLEVTAIPNILAELCTETNKIESVLGEETEWPLANKARPDAADFAPLLVFVDQVGEVIRALRRALNAMSYDPNTVDELNPYWDVTYSDIQFVYFYKFYGDPEWFPYNHCYVKNYTAIKDVIGLFQNVIWPYVPAPEQVYAIKKRVVSYSQKFDEATETPQFMWDNAETYSGSPLFENSIYRKVETKSVDYVRTNTFEKNDSMSVKLVAVKKPVGTYVGVDGPENVIRLYGDDNLECAGQIYNDSNNVMVSEGESRSLVFRVDEDEYDDPMLPIPIDVFEQSVNYSSSMKADIPDGFFDSLPEDVSVPISFHDSTIPWDYKIPNEYINEYEAMTSFPDKWCFRSDYFKLTVTYYNKIDDNTCQVNASDEHLVVGAVVIFTWVDLYNPGPIFGRSHLIVTDVSDGIATLSKEYVAGEGYPLPPTGTILLESDPENGVWPMYFEVGGFSSDIKVEIKGISIVTKVR